MRRRPPLLPRRIARRRRVTPRLRQRLRRFRRRSRGQALIEYAIITFFVLMAAGGVAFAFLPQMINAYQVYFDSFYFVLNLPIP